MIWVMVFRSYSALWRLNGFLYLDFSNILSDLNLAANVSQGHYIVLVLTTSHMWKMLLGVFD